MLASLLPLCLSWSVSSSLSPLPAPQGPQPVTEVLSLQHLVTPAFEQALPPWGSLLQRPTGDLDMLASGEGEAPIGTDEIVSMLRELHGAAIDGNRLRLEGLAGSLVAIGEAGEVAKVKDRLRQASAVLTRPLQVEFAVWDAADRETPNAVLTAAEFARTFANMTPVSRGVTTTHHGRAAVLERMRWTSYVRDIGADVAQKQSLTHPVTEQFGEGAHAAVRAFSLTGSDEFAVHVQFAVGQRRGVVRTLTTGMVGAADLELPILETDYGTFSGRVGNGGAVVATLRGHASAGGQRILTVRVTSRTPPPNPVQDGLGIFPCATLTNPSLQRAGLPFDEERGARAAAPTAGPGQIPADGLLEFLRANLGAEAENASLQCADGFLFARAAAPVLARIDGLLRGLQDRLLRTATVRHVGTLEVPEGTPGATASLLHELTAPTLLGRHLTLARHLETNFVAEVFTAIAQEASSLDPGIRLLQSGCWLTACVAPTDEGLQLRLQGCTRHAVVSQARSVMPGGVLMTSEVGRVTTGHDGVVANGQAIEHGDGPAVTLDGRTSRSALATTVRW